jgi:hypothetical protein
MAAHHVSKCTAVQCIAVQPPPGAWGGALYSALHPQNFCKKFPRDAFYILAIQYIKNIYKKIELFAFSVV